MKPFRTLSAVEQLAAHLRGQILAGELGENLPGVHRLAKALGVSPKTVVAAVAQLEHEGLLEGRGARHRTRILPPSQLTLSRLRVMILLYDINDRTLPYVHDLEHQLRNAGHAVGFASRTLLSLGRDLGKLTRFAARCEVDAWIVLGGSREILEWFARQPVPAYALFGRRRGVPIAGTGPDKLQAVCKLTRHLLELGHRRIVMVVREERRKPRPGMLEQAFLDELSSAGIATGLYHLPEWEETPDGFRRCIDNLFGVTPPTAMIMDEALFFTVAQLHLARRGILAPGHISLVCMDPDPSFAWLVPSVAHIRWDPAPVVRKIVHWVGHVAQGRNDLRQTNIKAEFVEGGTIGPPPGVRRRRPEE